MNPRIRELALQAGGEFWQRLENDAVNPEAYITFDPPESLEKFVHLIARECARIAIEKQTENDIEGIVSKNPAKDFAYALIKHFGVEQ